MDAFLAIAVLGLFWGSMIMVVGVVVAEALEDEARRAEALARHAQAHPAARPWRPLEAPGTAPEAPARAEVAEAPEQA